MASPLANKIDLFLKAHHSPLAGHGNEIVAASKRYYKKNPTLLASLIVGIAGAEQSYGTTGNADVTQYHNLWGYGHPPSGLTSRGMFGSWGQGIDTVAQALSRDYLGQGLTRPETLYGRWVKGDPVSTAAQGGYTAPWISTVGGALTEFGATPPGDPVTIPVTKPAARTKPLPLAPMTPPPPPPIDFSPFVLSQLGKPNWGLGPLMDFVQQQEALQAQQPQFAPTPVPRTPRTPTALRTETKPAARSDGKAAKAGYPLGKTGAIIGTPYSGTHTLGNWQSDNAVDIAVPVGTPVYATTDGVIGSRIGSLGRGGQFAGLRLTLTGGGNGFYYAHLSKLTVKAGQRVKKGQLLGYSGEANGVAHLHIGIQHGDPRKVLL